MLGEQRLIEIVVVLFIGTVIHVVEAANLMTFMMDGVRYSSVAETLYKRQSRGSKPDSF